MPGLRKKRAGIFLTPTRGLRRHPPYQGQRITSPTPSTILKPLWWRGWGPGMGGPAWDDWSMEEASMEAGVGGDPREGAFVGGGTGCGAEGTNRCKYARLMHPCGQSCLCSPITRTFDPAKARGLFKTGFRSLHSRPFKI